MEGEMFPWVLIPIAVACIWFYEKCIRYKPKKYVESEPDPLAELEAAHHMELAEWDAQFDAKPGAKPIRYLIDPGQEQRDRYLAASRQNRYIPGLHRLGSLGPVQAECEAAEQQSQLQRQAMLAAMVQQAQQPKLAQDAFQQLLGTWDNLGGHNGRSH